MADVFKSSNLLGDAARNEVLILVARFSIIIATSVGLPVAGFFMSRLVNTQDTLGIKIDAIGTANTDLRSDIRVLSEKVQNNDSAARNTNNIILEEMKDHETRIRAIERNILGASQPNDNPSGRRR